ncbi:MAG: copper homeostasis protein CutC [Crocinitomicaceae bacterium]|nr:copper homeostasis protein CutC [Crocinitomicaceae bacterium]
MDFEVCLDHVDTAIYAGSKGAKRVELCGALSDEGLTPSYGMIKACVDKCSAEVYVMIRPVAGGFEYSENEIQSMESDIEAVAHAGGNGVVFGILDANGEVDMILNKRLLDKAKSLGLGVTYHRAIDLSNQPVEQVKKLIELGFDRILTSGAEPTVGEGIETIKEMVKVANGRIEIMAGCGIDETNVQEYLNSGIDAVHFQARTELKSPDHKIFMGHRTITDTKKIDDIVAILEKH